MRGLLRHVDGVTGLIIRLLYGTGMRLMEALRLRVKDIDFGANIILVRSGKGDKDRVVPLPASLIEPLRQQLDRRLKMHHIDQARGMVDVELPHALARKYPNAPREWAWQYVFASRSTLPAFYWATPAPRRPSAMPTWRTNISTRQCARSVGSVVGNLWRESGHLVGKPGDTGNTENRAKPSKHGPERWQSGRMHRIRNPA